MSLLSDPRSTRHLQPMHNERTTRPLYSPQEGITDQPTTVLSRQTRPLNAQVYIAKQPFVIPAATKRKRTDVLRHRRSPIVLLGVLLGSIIVFVLATFLVAPLDNGQHPSGLAQTVNDWFTSVQSTGVNPLQQHVDPPTPTPALLTNEGYCGGNDIWGTCATAITASHVMGTGQMQHPLAGAIITQYFAHPEYQIWCGCWRPHTGIDLAAAYGSPVMAADSGQVIWTGWDWSGLGWAVKINHGHYIATIYGHLARFIVSVGQNVNKGQVIAYEGSTGASTGPHVHFMVLYNNIWVNPLDYVQLP